MSRKMEGTPKKPDGVASFWRRTWPLFLIGVAGLLVYANSFRGPFVFDDVAAIRGNPTITKLSDLGRILFPEHVALDRGVTVEGRPLLNLSFAINHAIGGFETWGYHAVNLLIHVLAGLTLYGIVRRTLLRVQPPERIGSAQWLPLVAALLWLVHPLQTESVTYIVQRAESLVGLLYLLTLYCFIRGVDGSRWWRTGAVALCALGMTAKEVMATAPLMVLLYDWVFVSRSFKQLWQERRGFYLALFSTWAVLAALLVGTAGSNLGILQMMFSPADKREPLAEIVGGMTWWDYTQTQFGTVVHYLRLCIWPSPLIFDYGTEPARGFWAIVPAALIVLLLLAATVFGVWRRHWAGFAGAWFFLILAPTTSVIPTNQTAAEHRMYLPLAAVVVLLVAGGRAGFHRLQEIMARDGKRSALANWALPSLVTALILLLFGGLTLRRNRDYQSERIIWQDTVQKRPTNARAQNNLGGSLLKTEQSDEALAHFEVALKLKPDSAEAHNNLSVAYLQKGQVDESMIHSQKALALKPGFADAHNNLGNALLQKGRLEEAMAHCQRALELKSDYAEAHTNLGNAFQQKDQMDEAIAHYQKALELKPDHAEAHTNLGNAYRKNERLDEAIACHRNALKYKPNYAEAHNNLANVLLQKNQLDEALAEYAAALKLKPNYADAHHNLGSALLQKGRLDEALVQYQKALELNPVIPLDHLNLGIILFQSGRTGAAMKHYELAIKSNPGEMGALNNLAWILATNPESSRRNGARALELAQKASQLSGGNHPVVLHTLAAAYAECGRFAEADEVDGRALSLAETQGDRGLADAIRNARSLYQTQKPLRDARPAAP